MNLGLINDYVRQGYIRVQTHPKYENLRIYNYTEKTQYEGFWNEETLMCRGLVMDGERIIARPFKKFFNLEEHINAEKELPEGDFEVFEKLDGSLGIAFYYMGDWHVATRGSFSSEQAVFATNHLREILNNSGFFMPVGFTHLFEIIYPENRIVVDYGDFRGLKLLAVLKTNTGEEVGYSHLLRIYTEYGLPVPFTLVDRMENIKSPDQLHKLPSSNKEGFVIRFSNGLRLKFKFDEYKRLHRLITGVNEKHIWEILKNNESLESILDKVPDEYYKWVRNTESKLRGQYDAIHLGCNDVFKTLNLTERLSRKEMAEKIKDFEYKGIVFCMLDNKPYEEQIWKLIKPKVTNSFKKEI